MKSEQINQDVQEAMLALASSSVMREAGLDEKFVAMFSRNCPHFGQLPPSTQRKISEQFGNQAHLLSCLESGGKNSADKAIALVKWLQGVNPLMAREGVRPPGSAALHSAPGSHRSRQS